MAIFGDTTEFYHPEFTEEDLPAVRTHLAMALEQIEKSVNVASNTKNGNVRGLEIRLRGLRDSAHLILNTLDRRF